MSNAISALYKVIWILVLIHFLFGNTNLILAQTNNQILAGELLSGYRINTLNITFPDMSGSDYLDVDLNRDKINDIRFFSTHQYTQNSQSCSCGMKSINSSLDYSGSTMNGENCVSNIFNLNPINNAISWTKNSSIFIRISTFLNVTTTNGLWLNNDGYVGIRRISGTDTIYEWIQIKIISCKIYLNSSAYKSYSTDIDLNNNFLIYPNPASDIINIESNLNIDKINIISMDGNVNKTFSATNTITDISELNNGFYIIEIITKSGGLYRNKLLLIK